MAKKPRYVYDQAVKQHYVRAWQEGRGRNADIVVQVWLHKDKPEGEPEGDWAMPGVLGYPAAVAQAIAQTSEESGTGKV